MQVRSFVASVMLAAGLLTGCGNPEAEAQKETTHKQSLPVTSGMLTNDTVDEPYPNCFDLAVQECAAPQQWRETCVYPNGRLGQCHCSEMWICT